MSNPEFKVKLECDSPPVDTIVSLPFVPRLGDVIMIEHDTGGYGHTVTQVLYKAEGQFRNGHDVVVRLDQKVRDQ